MGGRPSKPIELLAHENKTHLTKEEIEHRKQAEQSLYTGETFLETEQVKKNEIAHEEFLRLQKLYSNITYIDALDQGIINRYCLEIATLERLQNLFDMMESKVGEAEPQDLSDLYKSINGILGKINKSKELLLKYEDRLFLHPTARIKAIPKKPEKEEKTSGVGAFMQKKGLIG